MPAPLLQACPLQNMQLSQRRFSPWVRLGRHSRRRALHGHQCTPGPSPGPWSLSSWVNTARCSASALTRSSTRPLAARGPKMFHCPAAPGGPGLANCGRLIPRVPDGYQDPQPPPGPAAQVADGPGSPDIACNWWRSE